MKKLIFKISIVMLGMIVNFYAKAEQAQTANAVISCNSFSCQIYCDGDGDFNEYCSDFIGIQKDWCLNSHNNNPSYAQACANLCNCTPKVK